MKESQTVWETKLWSYVKNSNGRSCPGFDSCCLYQDSDKCFNNNIKQEKLIQLRPFIDNDFFDLDFANKFSHPSDCLNAKKIIKLIRKLTQKYLNERWNGYLPIPDNLFLNAPDNLPIEIRYVPLKTNLGAVWRQDDAWLIYLNSNCSPARQRFTLYHEIFHILAHCNGCIAVKRLKNDKVCFYEFLADVFSFNILMPQEFVITKWSELRDINQMAKLFEVPLPLIYNDLLRNKLI